MSIFRNSFIYTGLSVAQKAVGFLLLPIYTAYLAPSDYGVIGTVTSLAGLLIVLYPLGGDNSLVRNFYPSDIMQVETPVLWGTLTTFLGSFALAMTILLSLTHRWILDRIMGAVPFWPYIALGLGMALCTGLRTFYSLSLRVRQRGYGYLAVEGSFMLVRLALLLLFIAVFHWKAFGALLAFFIAEASFCVIALILFSKDLVWKFDRRVLRQSLAYSLPIVPNSLAGWAMTYMSALVVNHYVGMGDAGLYTLAANLVLLQTFMITGFNDAYLPPLYEALSTKDPAKSNHAWNLGFFAFCIFGLCTIVLTFFSREVLMMMTPSSYWNASKVVPWLVLAGFLHSFYIFFTHLLCYYKGGTRYLPIASLVGAVVSIVLMYLWVPRYSYLGAGAASCAGVGVRMAVTMFICYRKFTVPWPPWLYNKIGLLTLAVMAFFFLAPRLGLATPFPLGYKMFLLAAYTGVLLFWLKRLPRTDSCSTS